MKKVFNTLLTIAMVMVMAFAIYAMASTTKDIESSNKQLESIQTSAKNGDYKLPERYTMRGRYNGNFAWQDETGNIWRYEIDAISGADVYNGMPVFLVFDDNATPDNRYDDEIIGAVYDRETAIYDKLEESLSSKFELERDGNNIHINSMKEEN